MSPTLVLVEPAGPLNVGSVARLCRNYGIEDLRLVAPRCDPLGEEARLMAVKGLPLLERATIFPTLAAALADCGRVVAATGRPEGSPCPWRNPMRPWPGCWPATGPCRRRWCSDGRTGG